MHPTLNLPAADLRFQNDRVWDPLRKKYLLLTREEWVRQHFISYLINHLGYSASLMMSEYEVNYEGQKKRCDIVIFNSNGTTKVIIECKEPRVAIDEDTFYQTAKYNRVLQAPILIMTNGMEHYCALVDYSSGQLNYLESIPSKEELEKLIG